MTVLSKHLLRELVDVGARSEAQPLDAVIVGGGSTGLTTARVLAEAGCSVAVLEAGPLALLTHAATTDLRFSVGAVHDLQQALSYSPASASGTSFGALVSCLGGRGMFWSGAAPRYLDADFAGWPMRASELREHYRWAERELFVSRAWGRTRLASAVSARLAAAGIQAEPEPFAVAAGPSVNGHLRGTVGNPMSLLLRSGLFQTASLNRPSLVGGARVLRVELGAPSDPVALSVADAETSTVTRVFARTVVLAAGGFESVRLALVSGLPDGSGTLGGNLSDHWFVRAYYPLPAGFYDDARPEAGALIVRPTEGQPFQMELHLPGRRFFNAEWPWLPASTDEYSVMVRAFAPVYGRGGSRIEASPGDAPGSYVVHLEATAPDEQLTRLMGNGLEHVRAALDGLPARVDVMPLGSSYHEAGGLQMSTSRDSGVVDAYGRFWSDQRVRVVDASAWPSIGAANPHLTLVALARRQALMLASDITRS